MALLALQCAPAEAVEVCKSCHPTEVEHYLLTGMGRSISRPSQTVSANFRHEHSGSSFAVSGSESGMVQTVRRGGLGAEYPVEYVIGSGNAAFGFLIRVEDYLYQSPISYYTHRDRWDMAPGFELHPAPDFDRPVLHECLWCHAGRPRPVAFTQNRYRAPFLEPQSISCDRCHGPPERHLAAPSRETIVNPVRLSPSRRDSVCEQCHLGGEERVLNPGRTFGEFRPGMELEDVFSVYVGQGDREAPGRFKVVGHVEQLALSQCYQASGTRMWCGTCHDPHSPVEDTVSHYRARCLSCHGETLDSHHAAQSEGCIDCHMVRRPSFDSGHSAFTDHRIERFPQTGADAGGTATRIRAWREADSPILAQRNLGLAYARLGQRRKRPDFMDEGASLLAQLAQAGVLDPEGLEALGTILLSKQAPPEAGLGELARDLLNRAWQESPSVPARLRTLAAAEWQSGRTERAVELLRRSTVIDPQNRAAYEVLARIHSENGRPAEALRTWRRYLELVPASLAARTAVEHLEGESLAPPP